MERISILHQLIGRTLGSFVIESGLRQPDGTTVDVAVIVGDSGAVLLHLHPDDITEAGLGALASDQFVRLALGQNGPFVPGTRTEDGRWLSPPAQLTGSASRWLGAKYPHLKKQPQSADGSVEDVAASAAAF